MKTLLLALSILLVFCQPAAAQSPPATGINNYCFTLWQCETEAHWLCGYHAYQANEGATLTPQCGTTWSLNAFAGDDPLAIFESELDNMCSVNWTCETEAQWTLGYNSYQALKSEYYPQLRAAKATPAIEAGGAGPADPETGIDNLCFTMWQCESEADWVRGYYAYQIIAGAYVPRQGSPRQGRRGAEGAEGGAASPAGVAASPAGSAGSTAVVRALVFIPAAPDAVPHDPLQLKEDDDHHDHFVIDCGTPRETRDHVQPYACDPDVVVRPEGGPQEERRVSSRTIKREAS